MGLRPDEIDALLGAWALDALDAEEEEAALSAALEADAEMATRAAALRSAAGELATAGAAPAPRELLDAVLDGASRQRGVGIPTVGGTPAAAIEAFASQEEALGALLDEIAPGEWAQPTIPYAWNVHELLAHLVAVESYVGGLLGLWEWTPPEGTELDHLAMSEATVAVFRDRDPAETVAAWRQRATAILEAGRSMPDEDLDVGVVLNGFPMSVRSLFIARTFELWTHADDMRAATGRALVAPPPGVLRAMSNLSVTTLPMGMLFVAPEHADRPAKVVLTGPGGGTWYLGDTSREPEVVLVADVVDYCRVVSRRIDLPDLEADVEGDPELLRDLLEASRLVAA